MSPAVPSSCPSQLLFEEIRLMEDLLWIFVMVGLLAATLAYARLCDNA